MGRRRGWYRSLSKGEAGCMSGMLHFLDIHHTLFAPGRGGEGRVSQVPAASKPQHYSAQLIKGVEAPRNSLELDEEAAAATTKSAAASALAEEYYGIPVGIQVNAAPPLPKLHKRRDSVLVGEEEKRVSSSRCETPRTPNVVAKLMGLEILPDGSSTPSAGFKSQNQSPRLGSTKRSSTTGKQCVEGARLQPLQKRDTNLLPNVKLETGSRSLPDTPRASSERSRDACPRLSLQINKENLCRPSTTTQFYEVSQSLPPSPTCGNHTNNRSRRREVVKTPQQDEDMSPRGHCYAKEIVKQAKENAATRRGSSNSSASAKTKSAEKRLPAKHENRQDFTAPSTSPPPAPPHSVHWDLIRQPKRRPIEVKPKPPSFPSADLLKVREKENAVSAAKAAKMAVTKSKKTSCERFTERIKKQPRPCATAARADSFLDRLVPIQPPSSSFLSTSSALPQKKTQSNCTLTPTRKNEEAACCRPPPLILSPTPERKSRHQTCTREQVPEFIYVRSILKRAGIMSSTQVRWYSPSLPIDPFVFHQLELDLPLLRRGGGPLRHRCNRKLLFHLVVEILGDLLSCYEPTTSGRAQRKRLHEINKDLLLDRLWTQIWSFPQAYCQVIGDIDALVAGDLAEARVRRLLGHPLVAAEAEEVALEIEREVFGSVLGEAAESLALCSRRRSQGIPGCVTV